jgi:hypothetical protein
MNDVKLPIDIDSSNRCYSDYKNFIDMNSDELVQVRDKYYQDLKNLQNDLDQLLIELKKSKLYHLGTKKNEMKFKQAV